MPCIRGKRQNALALVIMENDLLVSINFEIEMINDISTRTTRK